MAHNTEMRSEIKSKSNWERRGKQLANSAPIFLETLSSLLLAIHNIKLAGQTIFLC